MYMKHYEQVAEETSERIRNNELRALEHSILLMRKASDSGMRGRDVVEAAFFVNRLWGVLLEDLASPDNALPKELRAKLISIGIWILRAVESVRQGAAKDFDAAISVSETIASGLRNRNAHPSQEK